jgi:hypothetical protein
VNKQSNNNIGITALSICGTSFSLTVSGIEVKILPDGDATRVWVDGVQYSRSGSANDRKRYVRVIYPDTHFQWVNWLVEHKHYSKEAAIGDIAKQKGWHPENFRRAYYDRKGSLLGCEEPQ